MIRKINTIDDMDEDTPLEEPDSELLEEIKRYSDDKLQSEYVKCGKEDLNSERFALIQQELFDRGIFSAEDDEDEKTDDEDTNDDDESIDESSEDESDESSDDDKDHSVEIMDSVGLISNFEANELPDGVTTLIEVRSRLDGGYRCYVSERDKRRAEYRTLSRNELVDLINSDDAMVQFYTSEQMNRFMSGKDLDAKELSNMDTKNSILLFTSVSPNTLISTMRAHYDILNEAGLFNSCEVLDAKDYPFVKWGWKQPKSVVKFNFGVSHEYAENLKEFFEDQFGRLFKSEILDFSQLKQA